MILFDLLLSSSYQVKFGVFFLPADFILYNTLNQKAASRARTDPLLNVDSVSQPTPTEIAKDQEVV